MNQINTICGDEPNEKTREWNGQPSADHFKSCTPPHNTSPVFLNIIGRRNCHAIDNGYVKVYTSYLSLENTSGSVADLDNTQIKSSDYDSI